MTSQPLIPSDDWELNIVLLKIAKELDSGDLTAMKFLCSGCNGIPKTVLDRLTTPEKLFTYLRERNMLSRDNLLLLQAFLWHVGRSDLIDVAAEYAVQAGDTLYFYAPNREPENGFKHVKFHVNGNLENFHRKELENMRANVARLLFVPAKFVFLCGVEPANSLLLTFMLHGACVDRLKTVVRTRGGDLNELGIDTLYVDNEVIAVQEQQSNGEVDGSTSELSSLFQKTVKLESLLEETDVRLLTTREEVQRIERIAHKLQNKESYIRGLLCAALESKQASSRTDGVLALVQTDDGRIII
ncbi:uncharacterized protein LOC121372636 [Gigantopelta aegis]|uniref:uncharacterized protein LOC121372636 n=1 Tax=Gigantopelta aegis TaxID=1735272 RepID=UPI001B88BBAB|nr:uncharacterized protein LOC121372636 [Gigantopelta aegis]